MYDSHFSIISLVFIFLCLLLYRSPWERLPTLSLAECPLPSSRLLLKVLSWRTSVLQYDAQTQWKVVSRRLIRLS